VFNLVKLKDPADVFKIFSDYQAEIVLMPFPAESLILSERGLRKRSEPEEPMKSFIFYKNLLFLKKLLTKFVRYDNNQLKN
jgi:hypothetical protein